MCMYIYICIYTHISTYISTHIYIYIYIYILRLRLCRRPRRSLEAWRLDGLVAWRLGGLEARWLYGSVSPRFGGLWVPWSGLSRLASVCSALLEALRVEMLQNVAVAKEWLVFLKNMLLWRRFWRGTPPVWGPQQHVSSVYTHLNCFFKVFEATRG